MANKGRRTGIKTASEKQRRALYVSTNRRLTNKIKKLKKHIKRLPGDSQAINSLKLING